MRDDLMGFSDAASLEGAWCVFPLLGERHDAVRIGAVEEIGVRFGGIPYLRFRAQHDSTRVLEVLGGWIIKRERNAVEYDSDWRP